MATQAAEWIKVADVSEVPEGEAKSVQIGEDRSITLFNVDGGACISWGRHGQSIEPIETPPHANALKSLNYQPFAGTFDHPAADRKPYRFKVMILDVCVMRVEIIEGILHHFS